MSASVSDIAGRLTVELSVMDTAGVRAVDAQQATENSVIRRMGIVDESLTGNDAPYFKSFEKAVDWARNKVATNGGRVLLRTYFDLDGDPIDPDPTTYPWYTPNSNDQHITFVSGVPGESGVPGAIEGGGFLLDVFYGRDINLNDVPQNINLNNFTADVNLSEPEGSVTTEKLAPNAVTGAKTSSPLGVDITGDSDTVDGKEADTLLWMSRLIRGSDINLNDAPYDVNLNDFRTDIEL